MSDTDTVPDELVIEPYMVERLLSRIAVRKSPGCDEIPNWFLHDFSVWLAEPVCCIFNTSVRQGVFPKQWKQANVVPVPKVKPPRNIESDLRPISLTPTLSKLLESFIGRWIVGKILPSLDQKQFGAIKGRSTTHALIDMLHTWHSAQDQQKLARILFVDFAKAFDRVDHSIVISKLIALGLPGSVVKWFASFLANRQQRVKIGCAFSNWLQLNGSMPQGSWLGPLSFIILIDDLKLSCLTHKFVDDTTVTEILSRRQQSSMQQYYNELVDWTDSNLMRINDSKTKEMIIGSDAAIVAIPPLLSSGSDQIERVDRFKLLGITISRDLKWSDHIDIICSKASSRIHFLKLLKRSGVPTADLLHYYVSVIRPTLEYACPVWHSSITSEQSDTLENMQKRALRVIYGSRFTDASYCSFCNELSLSPFADRREQLTFNFFSKMLNPNSCLSHLIPERRDKIVLSRLRNAQPYPVPFARTQKLKKSFIVYALSKFQILL